MDVNTFLDILSMLNLKGRRLPLAPNSRIFNSILKAVTPPKSIHAVQKGRVLRVRGNVCSYPHTLAGRQLFEDFHGGFSVSG